MCQVRKRNEHETYTACVGVKGLTMFNYFSIDYSYSKIVYFIICLMYTTKFSLSSIGVHAQHTSIRPHRRKALTCISIYRLKGCIEPFVYKTGARFKSHLNDISLGVHRRGKLLTTDLKVIRFSSMRGNVCDKDSGTICCRSSTVIVFTCYHGKAQEGQFDDFPMGYRDIPGTNPVCFIHVGEIEAGNVTTRSINIFSRRGTG